LITIPKVERILAFQFGRSWGVHHVGTCKGKDVLICYNLCSLEEKEFLAKLLKNILL
jgi:hypothetical protein